MNGETDFFTHMMPFYKYDVAYTCGPDPKVCCQFDFMFSCSWGVQPIQIDDSNVRGKANLLIDQWKRKAALYKTGAVLIPLGEDFRYKEKAEWEEKRRNFAKLFDFINIQPSFHVEAKFSTLQEYFDAVHSEKSLHDFPSLSGDFFTYADLNEDYWSGYFTSRPFHKRLDRILLTYLRLAF